MAMGSQLGFTADFKKRGLLEALRGEHTVQ